MQNEDDDTWSLGSARVVRDPSPVVAKPRKLKKVPENASSMHPAMLLTVLRPHATYRELNTEVSRARSSAVERVRILFLLFDRLFVLLYLAGRKAA